MMRKQTKVLKVYFLTEIWERCEFYVVQSLLIFLFHQHIKWQPYFLTYIEKKMPCDFVS